MSVAPKPEDLVLRRRANVAHGLQDRQRISLRCRLLLYHQHDYRGKQRRRQICPLHLRKLGLGHGEEIYSVRIVAALL